MKETLEENNLGPIKYGFVNINRFGRLKPICENIYSSLGLLNPSFSKFEDAALYTTKYLILKNHILIKYRPIISFVFNNKIYGLCFALIEKISKTTIDNYLILR